jgi:hypothetical protein
LKKGDLGGFQVLIKIPPDPPLGKGGKKTCLADVTLIMKQTTRGLEGEFEGRALEYLRKIAPALLSNFFE